MIGNKEVLQLYAKGEREFEKFLPLLIQLPDPKKRLEELIKRHNLKIIEFKSANKARLRKIVQLYMEGYREAEDFVYHECFYRQGLTYTYLQNIKDVLDYPDISIPPLDEIDIEKRRQSFCKWAFNESDEEEMTIEEFEKRMDKFFYRTPLSMNETVMIREWLENYYKYFGDTLEGMSEKQLRLIFQRQFNIWGSETLQYKTMITLFHKCIPDFIKAHNIKDFKIKKNNMKKDLDFDDDLIDNDVVEEEVDEECLIEDEPLE